MRKVLGWQQSVAKMAFASGGVEGIGLAVAV